ncbi:MAG: VWA domain-containing protein [Vicinamibacterales bacterium]
MKALVLLAAAALAAQAPTFRGGVDLVNFGVTVSADGAFLTDLSAEDFEILEDGTPQAITYFARGGQAASAPPLHVGLLFDTSGSMNDDIALARTAAIRFLNTLRDARDMTLVDFDTEVRVSRYAQADFPRLVERIRNRQPGGMTAMYDALGVYLDRASEDEGRSILVLYTDGGDTRSAISFGDVMTLVRASNATIYTVGFLQRQTGVSRVQERLRLTQLAEATGGEAFFPSTMNDVEGAYERIVSQIRAQYSLGYTSTNTRFDGTWRRVEVRVKRAGLDDVEVQARRGYFAAYRP